MCECNQRLRSLMDDFGEVVGSIYKTYFNKFWGEDDFNELNFKPRTFQRNADIYDLLTDRGYKYDLLHRTYTDPGGHPVLNLETQYEYEKQRK